MDTFQPYLDSVIRSGERTRSVWYLLVLILIAGCFGVWNTRESNPPETRVARFMDALICLSADIGTISNLFDKSSAKPDCNTAVDYAQKRHFFTDAIYHSNSPPDDPARTKILQELQKRTEQLLQRELDAHVISVPILGISIDGNDLWLLLSVIVIFLLRVLWACLERELDNLIRAANQVTNIRQKELIVMSQLFAVPMNKWHPFPVLLFLPLVANIYDLYTDYISFDVAKDLYHLNWFNLQEGIKLSLLIIVAILCYACYRSMKNIESTLASLDVPPAKAVSSSPAQPASI